MRLMKRRLHLFLAFLAVVIVGIDWMWSARHAQRLPTEKSVVASGATPDRTLAGPVPAQESYSAPTRAPVSVTPPPAHTIAIAASPPQVSVPALAPAVTGRSTEQAMI